MKRTTLIFFLGLLCQLVLAQSAEPWLEKKISISVQEKALEAVLKSLENDLDGMVFAYLPGSFDVNRKVTVKLDSVSLGEVLEHVFADQEVECQEMRGKVFLKKKKPKSGEGTGVAPSKRRRRVIGSGSPIRSSSQQASEKSANPVVAGRKQAVDQPTSKTKQAPPQLQAMASEALKTTQSNQVPETQVNVLNPVDDQYKKPVIIPDKMPQHQPFPYQNPRQFGLPELAPVALAPADTSASSKTPFWSRIKMPSVFSKKTDNDEKSTQPADEEPESKKLRLYAASTTAITPIGDEAGIKMGGRAVWLKNSRLGFGLAGYAIQNATTLDALLNADHRLAGGYGGLHFEYNLNPNDFLHLSFPLMVGGGGMTYVAVDRGNNDDERFNVDAQAVFMLEPGVSLEMNLLRYLKIGFDVTYRVSSDSQLNHSIDQDGQEILSASGLNGISAGFTVKFGIF